MPGYSQSAIAYWVGRAKDTTGTVNGRATTGWVSGQLWSATATSWGTRATDPGNLAYSKAANQDWATSASQWKANYDTEWAAARDPQGYSYSYPGQGANAVYWSQSASYWRGQADYYWGPSRVWNSGATWEANYNLYVGYYNNMVADRNAWQANANTAYTSGTWGSGETWHQAYDRVVPIGSIWSSRPSSGGDVTWNLVIPQVTVPYNGYYGIIGTFHWWTAQTGNNVVGTLWVGGSAVSSGDAADGVGGSWQRKQAGYTGHWTGYIGAGTVVKMTMSGPNAYGAYGEVFVVFAPTSGYPH